MDTRKEKRLYCNSNPLTDAYMWGQRRALAGKPYRNPYPSGERNKCYRDGFYEIADDPCTDTFWSCRHA